MTFKCAESALRVLHPFLRFTSYAAGQVSSPVPQLPEVCSKKNWLDYFLLLTSCQCGFVFTAATCKSKLQPAGRCEGEVPSGTYGPGPYPSLTPTHPAPHTDQGGLWDFSTSLTASSVFDGDLGASSFWLSAFVKWYSQSLLMIAHCCSHRGDH